MNSLESRLKTFSKWKNETNSSHLAITGFYATTKRDSDDTACVFCAKSLVGWEETDIPYKEHFEHSRSCLIFNLENGIARRKTFDFCRNKIHVSDATVLARNGFFAYSFLDGYDEFFCFKCGFCLEKSDEIEKAALHSNLCGSSDTDDFSFECKNADLIFYVQLLKGKFNENIKKYIEACNLNIVNEMDINLKDTIVALKEFNHVLTLKEYLNDKHKKEVENVDKIIQCSIFKSINEFNK